MPKERLRESARVNICGFGQVRIDGPIPRCDGTEKMMIGISAKNRNISGRFVRAFARLAARGGKEALIVIIDIPYAYNDAAQRGGQRPSQRELADVRRVGDEKLRMAKRAVRTVGARNIIVKRFDQVEREANYRITEIRRELEYAIGKSYEFRERMLDMVSEFLPTVVGVREQYLGFIVCELPVLIYLYYVERYAIDFYPGRNFPVFSELESGKWKHELPSISALVGNKRLSFVNCSGADVLGSPRSLGRF